MADKYLKLGEGHTVFMDLSIGVYLIAGEECKKPVEVNDLLIRAIRNGHLIEFEKEPAKNAKDKGKEKQEDPK